MPSLLTGIKRLLSSGCALHKMVSVLIVRHWQNCPHLDSLGPALLAALTDTAGLEDIVPFVLAMQRDCQVSDVCG